MRVIEPHHLRQAKRLNKPRRSYFKVAGLLFGVFLILAGAMGVWAYQMPLPNASAKTVTVESKGSPVKVSWPSYGQAAVGTAQDGFLSASSGSQKPVPMASTAKVMTALAILDAKPLQLNQQGPNIKLTAADVDLYNNYVANDGSVVLVKNGDQLSQLQALEALLLPSANNIADTLVNWAFGGMESYSQYANKLAKSWGLNNTTITSASGFPADTVSTANDLVLLGAKAMNHPVIAKIVGQTNATIPTAGQIYNTNRMLGQAEIVGIKTGNTDEAGGCYLFATKHKLSNNQTVTMIGAIMGAPTLGVAMRDSVNVLKTSYSNFSDRKLIAKGDKLGSYDLAWGGQVQAIAAKDLTVYGWNGQDLKADIYLNDIAANADTNQAVGSVDYGDYSIDAVLATPIAAPTWQWRLTRWL